MLLLFQNMTGFEAVYMWQDPAVSAPVFAAGLVLLFSILSYSLVSVVAYSALFVLGAVAGVQLYVYVMNTFLKKDIADPLESYAGKLPTFKFRFELFCRRILSPWYGM